MNLKFKILCYILFLIALIGCEKDKESEKFSSITYFNTEDGLPDSFIYCIAEDLEGNIWISTESGVAVYDGSKITVKFESFGAHDKITVDPKGNVWFENVFFGHSVYRYDGDKLKKFSSKKPLYENLSENESYYFSRDEIYYYHSNKWDTIAIPLYEDDYCGLNDVLLDSKGNFWVTTNDYCFTGVYKYDDNNWVDYNTREIFSSEIGNSLYGIIENRNNEILISAGGSILSYFNDKWDIYLNIWKKYGSPIRTEDLYEDSNNYLWFGKDNVYRYNGQSIKLFDISEYEKSGEYSRIINCFSEDQYGNIWVGTGDGLFRINN